MRIVAISDTHGMLPVLPSCDIFLHAGDVCPDGNPATWPNPHRQYDWFKKVYEPWVRAQPCGAWAGTWGNHDFCGGYGNERYAGCGIYVDQEVHCKGLRIWFSPWSKKFGPWAFMHSERDLALLYAEIPEGIDILVTHQPPLGYCDQAFPELNSPNLGSEELLKAIDRVRPRVVICGHIHGGHGHARYGDIDIYNVSIVDEMYHNVHAPTVIELEPSDPVSL